MSVCAAIRGSPVWSEITVQTCSQLAPREQRRKESRPLIQELDETGCVDDLCQRPDPSFTTALHFERFKLRSFECCLTCSLWHHVITKTTLRCVLVEKTEEPQSKASFSVVLLFSFWKPRDRLTTFHKVTVKNDFPALILTFNPIYKATCSH